MSTARSPLSVAPSSPSGDPAPANASIFAPGRNCWRVERATQVAFLIDGEEYFSAVRAALGVSALRDAGFEPVAPHLYGRGASIDDWAAHLLRDIDGSLVIVGASMGGYCALAMARRAPERVLGMVLVAATDRGIAAILLGDSRDELRRELAYAFPKAQLIAD